MKIAEVSKRYGVSTDTLRYYERIGLLRHVPRNGSGIRDYDEASCNAVEFVKCMRDAGMSIESLVEYMELIDQGDSTREARKELLARQSIAIPTASAPCAPRNRAFFPRCTTRICSPRLPGAFFFPVLSIRISDCLFFSRHGVSSNIYHRR